MIFARIGFIRLFSYVIIAYALILIGKLYYVQIVESSRYTSQAERQYETKSGGSFDRGSIFFTTKSGDLLSAATLKSGTTIAINPRTILNPEDVYNTLSGFLNVDENTFLKKVARKDDTYEEVAKRVDTEVASSIQSLKINGIYLSKEKWRFYPGGTRAAQALGFVGYKDNTLLGRYGLESFYNETLSRDHVSNSANMFAQLFLSFGSIFGNARESNEGDLITTIEPTVQLELENALKSVDSKWSSNLTGGIIMDPVTGEIYAIAANPAFDPNSFALEKNQAVFGNPLVENVYELGSIIKPLAVAAGLDVGVIKPDTEYNDTGSISVDGYKISNYDGKARGKANMQKVLNESLNVGMAFITKQLGNERLTKYYKDFGFGEETGIDVPGEVHGLIGNLNNKSDVEHITASFGQGIALTPIATVRALSALGNGGFLPNPHLVKEIRYTNGEVKKLSFGEPRQVLKKETSETISRMLVGVVDDALLGGTVKQDRYSIAAKTGTAQMSNENGGGYYKDRYLHSFFGYFPAYKPRFIVFLFTVYPKNVSYASHTLTDPFISLTKFLINYYNIPPDR